MTVRISGRVDRNYPKANFFRVDVHGNLELYSDPGGLDVSKVAVVAAGNWNSAEVITDEEE